MAEKRAHDNADSETTLTTATGALTKRAKQDDGGSSDEALLLPPRRSRRSASAREASDEPATTKSGESSPQPPPPPTLDSLQSTCDQLREELHDARTAAKAAKEQAALLKTLYDDASRSTVEAQAELEKATADNVLLRKQLSEGLATLRALSRGQTEQLRDELQHAEAQVHLLTRQNALTDDAVRAKAAKWDAMEAKEEEQRKEMQRRQAKREADRKALQLSLLGDDVGDATSTTTQTKTLPHDMFAVDLKAQKVDVDLQQDEEQESKRPAPPQLTVEDLPPYADDDDDDDDELAALQREAAQFSAGQRPV